MDKHKSFHFHFFKNLIMSGFEKELLVHYSKPHFAPKHVQAMP